MTIQPSSVAAVRFGSPLAFYVGCIAIVVGVLLHLPMLIGARDVHYRLAGMAMDPSMFIGMALIAFGIALATYGVVPKRLGVSTRAALDVRYAWTRAIDDAPFTREHQRLVIILAVALIIDIMKPATLAFVLPGMRKEYALSLAVIAWFPFSALTGLAIGSFVWGGFGDRIGRRATLLVSALFFMGTAICSAMPAFQWNVIMCFFMGLAAGGMLPIAITLLSELLPTRHRATLIVLLGGIGAVGGYLAVSACASLLEPTFGWRIMWLLNLPTGLILIVLNRLLPESPRFLLAQGRVQEAEHILREFCASTIRAEVVASGASEPEPGYGFVLRRLFRKPYLVQSLSVGLYGLSWGLVNYGFMLWLPLNLRQAGLGVASSDTILAKSTLVAFPSVIVVAWLYSRWSSRRSIVLFSLLTTLALLAFLPVAESARQHTFLLAAVIVALLSASTGMTSTLAPYSAEIYPTRERATGAGLAAGAGKFGGMLGGAAVLLHVTPTLVISAVLVAIPAALATGVLTINAIETRGRHLDETSRLAGDRAASRAMPRERVAKRGGTES